MNLKLPLVYVHWVDIIGSSLMLILAIWIFYEAFRLRQRSFVHLYLFLLSCALGTFAISRALGHILRNFLLYAGQEKIWGAISSVSGGANTVIFVLIASLSFYYGIFRNLQEVRDSEKTRYMKKLQDSQDFLQKVIDSLQTQLVVIDQTYRIIMANKKFSEDAMLSKGEIVGRPCYQVLHRFCDTVKDCEKEVSEAHHCPWKSIQKNGKPTVMRHIHRYPPFDKPRHMEISAFPVIGTNGQAEYVIETLTDVTEKLRIEEMKRIQEKLAGVMEIASAVAHELNTPIFTVLGNAQLLKRRFRVDDPAQRDLDVIIRNLKKMSGLTRRMTRITEYMTKDYVGGDRVFDFMRASDSVTKKRDYRQKQRDERETRWLRLEKMAAIGQLTGSVAHELNNALNIVLGYSQLLLREYPRVSLVHDDLKKIEKSAKQCQRIVSGLLDYTRGMTGKKEQRDVNQHLEDVINLVEQRMSLDGITIIRQFYPDLKPIMMDPDEMKQVYLNLFNNAAQAIGKNGQVLVKTEFDMAQNEVIISISDTGPGIPPDIMDEIFTPFFTTKGSDTGTGLGLNVSRDIVLRHGGILEGKNRPEGGAVFLIRLPANQNN